jgi:probable F420-dependent oxidoreductase
MKFGLFGINLGPCAAPAVLAEVARAAEAAGFDSVWTGEHVVLPDPQVPPSPLPAEFPMLDPAVALAYAAAHTSTISLATGIIILPQRNPLVLAKELASVDVLSGGRLVVGLGIGYLEAEFRALGVPFEEKGKRTVEYLEAMLAIWREGAVEYHGQFARFTGVKARPLPLQQPHPPIVFGGATVAAYRRALRYGHGWYGFNLDPEQTASCLREIDATERRFGRPAELGRLETSVTPIGEVTADTAKRFRDAGVDCLVLFLPTLDSRELLRFVSRTAQDLVGRI